MTSNQLCFGVPTALRHVFFLITLSGSVVLFIMERQYSVNAQLKILVDRIAELQNEQEKLDNLHRGLYSALNGTIQNRKLIAQQIEPLLQMSIRNNVMFFGIPEQENEVTIELIKQVINGEIGLFLDDEIGKAVRVDSNTSPRPILVKFTRWKDKAKVFYKRKSFASPIQLKEDLTDLQKQKREMLAKRADDAEAEGKKVKWSGKQLFIEGELVKL